MPENQQAAGTLPRTPLEGLKAFQDPYIQL